jgi:polynucleotide 5'-kinase involved in rRNA processing
VQYQVELAFADNFKQNRTEIPLNDPIMFNIQLSYQFLQRAYTQYVESNTPHEPLRSIRIKKRFDDWKQEVIDWACTWVNSEANSTHKRKQLYLYGVSNSGKTTLINSIFGNLI